MIYTKIGRLVQGPPHPGVRENDYTAAGVDTSLAESLARLGASRVHTLRVHDANDSDTQRDHGVDEVAVSNTEGGCVPRLVALRESGVLSGVSIGANSNNYSKDFHGTAGHHQGVSACRHVKA